MEKEYTWHVSVKNTPLLKRKCSHCNGDRHYCSNKFRLNSQKRNIDVWLIYRCTKCDSTYNLTILSRTKPEAIKKEVFLRLSANDEALAWEYAFSAEIARRNSVELDYSSVEYEMLHEPVSLNDRTTGDDKALVFKIKTAYHFGLKLSSVIKNCLGLSTTQINRMMEAGEIFTLQGYALKKHKVRDGDIILIKKEVLQRIFF